MDCVSPILNIVTKLANCTANHTAYISQLQKNLDSLKEVKRELEDIGKDIATRVEVAEREQYSQRTNQVKAWLETKQIVITEAEDFIERVEQEIQKKCLGSCVPRNCCSRYNLGKLVLKKIDEMRDLIRRGQFNVVADRLPPPVADERPMERVVGMDDIFSEVWSCIEDSSVGIVRLYGMGGVGKTTLLKKINNQFVDIVHDFDAVIWVVVSRELKVRKIQEAVMKKLHISVDYGDLDAQIFNLLRDKKFVLLLDDVWEPIDFVSLGIPIMSNEAGSKVIFTTRKEDLCSQMDAHRKLRIECLSSEAALDLFRLKLGENVLNSHHEIPKLAEIAARECSGLPLTIVTVARAMANWTTPEDWQREIQVLQKYRLQIPGMEDLVFHKLKFSYDSLSDDALKLCFLYCSIFPEDHNIIIDELIELWIGEGFLDRFDDIYEMRNHGENIIGRLKLACLLETGPYKNVVKMHDVIRDMALKLASHTDNMILVKEHGWSRFLRNKDVKRMSLWSPRVEFFDESPSCPSLLTILVRNTGLKRISNMFFFNMISLNVLDLSHNKDLTRLPVELGDLSKLNYLNLSHTKVDVLPNTLMKLTQLRVLLLDETKNLKGISRELISALSSLEVFSRILSATNNPPLHYSSSDEESGSLAFLEELYDVTWNDIELLEGLETLKFITDISITLLSVHSVLKFRSSLKLQCCVKRVTVMCTEIVCFNVQASAMARMKNLKTLSIRGGHSLREIKIEKMETVRGAMHVSFCNLCYIRVENCLIRELTWLKHAPTLRSLWIDNCPVLREIIAADVHSSSEIEEQQHTDLFPKLESMTLVALENLRSIFRGILSFPSLQNLEVTNCTSLMKIPFDSNSAKHSLNAIKGSRTWWDALEWDDGAAKQALASKFVDSEFLLFKPASSALPSAYTKQLEGYITTYYLIHS